MLNTMNKKPQTDAWGYYNISFPCYESVLITIFPGF